MQEREGREAGLSLDLPADRRRRVLGLGVGRPAGGARLGRAARLRRAQHHPPVQAGRGAAARRAAPRTPRDLGAVNTVVFRDGRHARPQHRLVGLRPGVPGGAARRGRATGWCSSAPVAPASRSATALLRPGRRARRRRSTRTADRADACVERLAQAVRRRPGLRRRRTSSDALAERAGRGQRDARSACTATPGTSVPADLLRAGPLGRRRRLLPAGDRAGRSRPGRAAAGCSPAAAWPSSRRSAPSSTSPVGPPTSGADGRGTSGS